MLTHNLGHPRIGARRELKKACENYWTGKISQHELLQTAQQLRKANWKLQKEAGLDLIPVNDFSFYDQVLDMSLMLGAIPPRYQVLQEQGVSATDLYFAMARGYQKDGLDLVAMEMTKWFDTNYHYIVPEFYQNQTFKRCSTKVLDEYREAKSMGIPAKPVLIGPVSYLLLGKEKDKDFDKLELLSSLLPVYLELLRGLEKEDVEWVQLDEPFLALDLEDKEKRAFEYAYQVIRQTFPKLKILLATYFEGIAHNLQLASSLPVCALHLDLVRAPEQLEKVINYLPEQMSLSLGVVDGRNIWKNNYESSLKLIRLAVEKLGKERVFIAPSCSLLHVPYDLELETEENSALHEVKQWLAFARQKLDETVILKELADGNTSEEVDRKFQENQQAVESRKTSELIHNQFVKDRVKAYEQAHANRKSTFTSRKAQQQASLKLSLFPTTTIGSFPQTQEVRSWRRQFKKGQLTAAQYDQLIEEETEKAIRWQEEIGIDVLVHGEFERNDMVEYFGEQLLGFVFTQNAWVQSYGSRCVKPPIIFGDVYRPEPMTVRWTSFAQRLTNKYVKGMLTGPVTILQWSFVRDDQPRSETCLQIAYAIRDEVQDLEKNGIKIIQIDEPAIREGLPLLRKDWDHYLNWAVTAFRVSAAGVEDDTQIHTHMCYSEFNDIIEHIAAMDADVISIETSRSQMELLDAFADFDYPNEIGPGVYDIHSPRVPTTEEMTALLKKAADVLPASQLWVNPDCGLKTRAWEETKQALIKMVEAAGRMRELVSKPAV
ncbi:5-methyltetrahydropteroyltriglutamate--homocysteine S-methyltransferase [Porifericola rhodea]|uniref:5-methyltetrahydropteroyltriglutamate-- homocysteine S-methyltransferase n=1 Tax=Porifericola rhodea TaxID=930972 RepID=UPI002666B934|nr:5-methyltetrahydropteroyltriglutamate--homocysteine S-methyltransferase [Porifericola rhodea]WKN30169.1 5-methyltetrahydropteroyltriglutamate--homocysteine S-methyltransferase [Porifericola rhodea]